SSGLIRQRAHGSRERSDGAHPDRFRAGGSPGNQHVRDFPSLRTRSVRNHLERLAPKPRNRIVIMPSSHTSAPHIESIESVFAGLSAAGYIAGRQIATAIYIAHHLRKPILVEGPAGVGKTELAKSVAAWLELPLIRMQCYEGLDESKALYEWKYGKQLLYTQILREKVGSVIGEADDLRTALGKLHAFSDVRSEERRVGEA